MVDLKVWEIIYNPPLVGAAFAMGSSQLFKTVRPLFTRRSAEFDIKKLTAYGGFPSGHTAFITSCAAGVGFNSGFRSSLFALSVVVACIMIYDILKQRAVIDLTRRETDRLLSSSGMQPLEKAPQFKAHSLSEVVGGGIWGIACAFIACLLM
jgi:acid phosphatase family membrane protein YuiD